MTVRVKMNTDDYMDSDASGGLLSSEAILARDNDSLLSSEAIIARGNEGPLSTEAIMNRNGIQIPQTDYSERSGLINDDGNDEGSDDFFSFCPLPFRLVCGGVFGCLRVIISQMIK